MNKKRKKRKKLKLKSVFIFLLFLTIFIGIIYLITLLKVRSFYIYNNKYLTDEEVLKELKLNNNSSFLLTNSFFEKPIIKNNKYIKNIKMERNTNLELKIYVDEYRLLFFDSKKNKVINEQGKEIDLNYNNIPVLINEIDFYFCVLLIFIVTANPAIETIDTIA